MSHNIARTPAALTDKRVSHRNLTDVERCGVYQQLLEMTTGGVLRCTAFQEVAVKYACHLGTVKRIWNRGQAAIKAGSPAAVVASRIRGNSGRKAVRSHDAIKAAIMAAPHNKRQTYRSMAAQTNIPMTTLIRHKKATPSLRARPSTISPLLTDVNKASRLA
ncbi:hypothetical protein SPRG_04411 [Saprolegnia parasitica CBS 223.65]|uniref:DUF7769 domain-containing protein n=1 Tax=Saprolegnia parasitica (strain CBS 223.65) TaxID=695850 RepID=A0A067CIE2_SAPPC|nr:hypothetical protein SPRG_04411 [Saprolegnia parasitica CBS 223.65]KDO30509.1 hypothetical protein SPRG_04411 [Saprolegnia parasitica CBS 223.65]|eukprot:XP_012198726.1 hypothetical protein SPRG_04411 [Saprolegnia parasitica CBS 223.65]